MQLIDVYRLSVNGSLVLIVIDWIIYYFILLLTRCNILICYGDWNPAIQYTFPVQDSLACIILGIVLCFLCNFIWRVYRAVQKGSHFESWNHAGQDTGNLCNDLLSYSGIPDEEQICKFHLLCHHSCSHLWFYYLDGLLFLVLSLLPLWSSVSLFLLAKDTGCHHY